MNGVFLVEIDVRLSGGRRLSDDEITDLIETVVDDLDRLSTEPSVGTQRVGDDLRMTVGVTVDKDAQFDALTSGVATIQKAFQTAGIGSSGLTVPSDLQSRVIPLQAA